MSHHSNKLTPPDSICLTVKEWIRHHYGKGQVPHYYKVLDPAHSICPRQPQGLENQLPKAFSTPCLDTWKGTLTIIPKGRLYGSSGAVLTSDNQLLWELSKEKGKRRHHSIFKRKVLPSLHITSKTVAHVIVKNSANYYHWLFDVLPRLALLKKEWYPH